MAALGALNVVLMALFGKGLRSATLRRAGHLEHLKVNIIFFYILINFHNFLFFVVWFETKRALYSTTLCGNAAAVIAATAQTKSTSATAAQQQQWQQHTAVIAAEHMWIGLVWGLGGAPPWAVSAPDVDVGR